MIGEWVNLLERTKLDFSQNLLLAIGSPKTGRD